MNDALFLAWRQLLFNRGRTALLGTALAIVMFLPLGLDRLVDAGETALRARAAATPLVAGVEGSPLDVVLSALYFRDPPGEAIAVADAEALASDDLARVIPLSLGFQAGHAPLVGTSIDYFNLRSLKCAEGRFFAVLGECVIGANVAKRLRLGAGDRLTTEPVNVLSLAGAYPIRMAVVGVLDASGGADDDAVFTDLRTTWVIGGLGHGHEDLSAAKADDPSLVIGVQGNVTLGSAKVREFVELDGEHRDAVHFHGDRAAFPLTAAIVLPHTEKSASILLGRMDAGRLNVALLRPSIVIDHLLVEVFRIRRILLAVLGAVGIAMVVLVGVVVALSIRIRAHELETFHLVGCAPGRVVLVLGFEIAMLLLGAAVVAATGAVLLSFASDFAVSLFTG